MEQAQPQRGLDEQAPDRFKVIPEEIEGQWRHPPAGETDQQDDEGHGHGKKSMLTKMKDKAKTLRTKVKKSMKPSHGASQEESPGESQEGSHETSSEEEEEDVEEQHQTDEKTDDVTKTLAGLDSFGTRHVLGDDNKSSVQHITAEKDPLMSSNKEEMITEETMKPKIGEVTTEATRSSLGLGKVQQIQDQGEEEKPMSTKLGESITDVDVDDSGRGEYKFAEDHFQTNPENPAPGKAWNQRSSEDADRGKENLEEFGVHNDTNSPENPGEEQLLSPGGKVSDNLKETPEKSELGKPWNERASEGLGFAKEKLQGYGVYKGIKSSEKPEESQSSVGNAQDKVSEIGEGKEMGSDKKSPNYTEEFKTDPSETDPGYVREASILGKEMGSDKKFPNYTEENKTGPSETDPGYVREASILAEELKTGLSFDQTSSNNEAKDTVIEGECKENEDGGTQQQQSEGEGKPGQSYASKIFSAKNAISSKLGYGGQINQDQTSSNNKAKDTVIEGERKENEDEGTQQQQREGEGKPGQSYVSKIYSAKDAISSKLGYGGQINQDQTSSNNKAKDTVIEGERKENEDEGTQQQQSEGEGKAGQSYASKIYSAKDAISSKLGYGGQTNQEPNVMGESKPADPIQGTATESMEGTKESKETFKSTIVSKLSPGEDHKALSEVITEAVSNSAKTLKDSLGGLYGGGGKVSTTDPNIGASESNNQSTPSNPPGGKGIVDRVTGVVGSFLGRKQEDNSEQHSSSGKPEPKSQVQVEEQVPEIPKF